MNVRVDVREDAEAAARLAAELVVFLVAGADKADAVERAFGRPPSRDTPASLARGRRTRVYLDPAAAAGLTR